MHFDSHKKNIITKKEGRELQIQCFKKFIEN